MYTIFNIAFLPWYFIATITSDVNPIFCKLFFFQLHNMPFKALQILVIKMCIYM